jgi:hypothetical protein
MRKDARSALIVALATLVHAGVAFPSRATAQPLSLAPSDMPRVGTVDERFNSYNVEMAEVIGGTFWKPYKEQGKAAPEPDCGHEGIERRWPGSRPGSRHVRGAAPN